MQISNAPTPALSQGKRSTSAGEFFSRGLWLRPTTWLALWVAAPLVATPALAGNELDSLVATALEQNPDLEAIAAQVTAIEHRVTRAGAWKNPRLMLAYQNLPIDALTTSPESMSMFTVRLEQTVPFFGKTEQRAGVVRNQVDAKRWELQEKRSQLRGAVKQAYYQLALARHLQQITRDHVGLVEQLIDAVRIKYEVGRAAQHDLIRLGVLRDRLTDDLDDFTRQDAQLTAALNAAMHRDVLTQIVTPPAFELAPPSAELSSLLAAADEARPVLHQLEATAKSQRAAAELAEFEAVPDPTFFVAYGERPRLAAGTPGQQLLTAGVAVPLPVFYGSTFGAEAAESTARANATDSKRAALLDTIAGDLVNAIATWKRAAGKVVTYETKLVPGAHRALDATFSSYQVDRADFLSLFDAELELLNFERAIRTAAVAGLVAQARIEVLTGQELKRSDR